MQKVRDKRTLAGRFSVVADGTIKSSVNLSLQAANVFETGPLDIGEGRKVIIDRAKWAYLFENFPNAPADPASFSHMRGKTLVIWGAGNVGRGSAEIAFQMGMDIVFIDKSERTLAARKSEFGGGHTYLLLGDTSESRIDEILAGENTVGLVDGCLGKKGGKAPTILTREMLGRINKMRASKGLPPLPIADASIDQGGGIEGIRPTDHSKPIMSVEDSDVYAVANVPGSRYTALYASKKLEEATIEDAKLLLLARAIGWAAAFERDPLLKTGLNTLNGHVTDEEVASQFGKKRMPVDEVLSRGHFTAKNGKIVFVVPREIKDYENRVGLLPSGVKALYEFAQAEGIALEVRVESQLGSGIGVLDEAYAAAGAVVVTGGRHALFDGADIVKMVKEPMGDQLLLIPDGAFVDTYFHYTGMKDSKVIDWALQKKIASFAYETRVDERGNIPSLIPMSDIDGRANILALTAITNPKIVRRL